MRVHTHTHVLREPDTQASVARAPTLHPRFQTPHSTHTDSRAGTRRGQNGRSRVPAPDPVFCCPCHRPDSGPVSRPLRGPPSATRHLHVAPGALTGRGRGAGAGGQADKGYRVGVSWCLPEALGREPQRPKDKGPSPSPPPSHQPQDVSNAAPLAPPVTSPLTVPQLGSVLGTERGRLSWGGVGASGLGKAPPFPGQQPRPLGRLHGAVRTPAMAAPPVAPGSARVQL